MECRHIRVLLDLSKLKERLHKYVWMLVSTTDLKSISDFKDAVIKKLALDRNTKDIKMFINGGLLLEEENILVLRENDTVQIQYENLSITDLHITSCVQVQDRLISNAEISSELFDDNHCKAVKSSKKKKRLSEVVVIDETNGNKEENLRKRKRDLVSNDSSENHDSVNFFQKENALTFCDINEKSIYGEKKEKKSCSSSTPKEDFTVREQYDGKTQKRNSLIFLDVDDESICDSNEKKNPQNSCTSKVKNVPILIEDGKNKNVIYAKSVFMASDNSKSTSKEKKRKSCSNSTSSYALNQNQQLGGDEEISTIPVEISLDDSSQEINKIEISCNIQNNSAVESFVQSNNCKKKKRRRQRKRKIEHNLISPFMAENASTFPQPVKDQPTFNSCDNFSGIRKHIKFTSPEPDSKTKETEIVDIETCNPKCMAEIYFETSPNDMYMSSNAMISSLNETDRNNTTALANVSSSNLHAGSSHKSLIHNSLTVSPRKSNYLNELSLKNPVSTSEPTRSFAMHSLEDYPLLNTLPCIGTCIAFKLLELNASYSPEVSSYKEGVIKSINPNTEEIEIELNRDEIKPGRIGKFENLKEGEDPVIEVTKKVKTCWSSLIEPRLLSLK